MDGRTVVSAGVIAAALSGCLEGPPADFTTSTTGTTSSATTGPGTTIGESQTSDEPSSGTTTTGTSTGVDATTGIATTTPTPTCDDGERNGDESDVDCGGSCPACADGKACKGPSDCQSGVCEGGVCVAKECDVDDDCAGLSGPCSRGVCQQDTHTCAAVPDHEGEPCDDGDLCTLGDVCEGGACKPGPALDCSEFDSACTIGVCDRHSGSCGAVDAPEGSPCDDGDGCTFNEACLQGACVAPASEGAILFADFSSAAGWTVEAPWEIGPAKASPNAPTGADPAIDHTPGDDNGVAGTAIGGLDPLPSHGYVCLTSPPVDATQIPGTVWLTFWRHLHTPATPAVTSKIEVWNGAVWKQIDSGYPMAVNDGNWTFQQYNVTGNAAPDFRVRFCMERQPGSPSFAGWSIDDVAIAPAPCTP
ncbi:MAG TPA: hypothetical protein VIK91_26430 [Nannocystis sp.]